MSPTACGHPLPGRGRSRPPACPAAKRRLGDVHAHAPAGPGHQPNLLPRIVISHVVLHQLIPVTASSSEGVRTWPAAANSVNRGVPAGSSHCCRVYWQGTPVRPRPPSLNAWTTAARSRRSSRSRRPRSPPSRQVCDPQRRPPGTGAAAQRGADLAAVSVEYYARVERGDLSGVSRRARRDRPRAQLDESEREHLADLARAAPASRARPSSRRSRSAKPGPHARRDDRRSRHRSTTVALDALGANPAGEALLRRFFADPSPSGQPRSFHFLDPRAHDFWSTERATTRGHVRLQPRDPYDKRYRSVGD